MAAKPEQAINESTASIKSALAVDASGGNVVLPQISRGVYVGVTGNLAVQFVGDADAASVVLVGLAAGVWHPMQIQKVLQTGTTATSVVVGF